MLYLIKGKNSKSYKTYWLRSKLFVQQCKQGIVVPWSKKSCIVMVH